MRVIAGSARGIELRAPRGRGTRPTSGRLREALFSMLEAADVDFSEVLDLYAGTGALGIEALSRGGEHCTFVESDVPATTVIRANLERTRLAGAGVVVHAARVGRWRPPADARYTLVVADPPYDDPEAWSAITTTVEHALRPDAIVVVEHAPRVPAPDMLVGLPRWRDRRQGDGAVAMYRASRPMEEDAE
jgi:16S rRNA (guanine966-N2)-methyltransferase